MSSFHLFARAIPHGFVIAIVGFFSSFPIVLQGLAAMGASEAQAASGLMAGAISMGLTGIALSLWRKDPIGVAWSTPGVALLAVSQVPDAGFAEALGGFMVAGLLTLIAGLWRPLGRLAAAVPAALAQAMLAGVLIALCVAPVNAVMEAPAIALPVVLTWFLIGRINRLFAVPAAVLAGLVVMGLTVGFPMPDAVISTPAFVSPVFTLSTALGIGVPLFIVTMASQNVPGIAVLRSFGFTPPPGPMLAGVGVASMLSAPLGAPATCLAAITAAMGASPDSHPDKDKRYWAVLTTGMFYCLFGLFAGVIATLAAAAPPMLLPTLAGVALIGVFANAAAAALEAPQDREAAAITFVITASGITIFGLGAAVWGLGIGWIVLLLTRRQAKG